MALNVHSANITGFDHLIGVNYRQRMTPEVQQTYANNIAFQGYMWVPCFTKSFKTTVPSDTYISYQITLPKVDLELCVKNFTSATGTLTNSAFKLYRNDIQVGSNTYKFALNGKFNEELDANGYKYILVVPKGISKLRLDIQAVADTILKPFTIFYRLTETR